MKSSVGGSLKTVLVFGLEAAAAMRLQMSWKVERLPDSSAQHSCIIATSIGGPSDRTVDSSRRRDASGFVLSHMSSWDSSVMTAYASKRSVLQLY